MAELVMRLQIILPRRRKAAMTANDLRAFLVHGGDVSSEMRFGNEWLIAIVAGKLPHSKMHFANVTVEFRTEQELFVAITAHLFPVFGSLTMTSQHVLLQMAFDDGLIRTVFAFVSLRVRMKNFVAGEHMTLQGGFLRCDKLAVVAVEETVEGRMSRSFVLIHAGLWSGSYNQLIMQTFRYNSLYTFCSKPFNTGVGRLKGLKRV